VVTTANLFDDFTLDNHGFFHPSYLKAAGQELGEAWAMMALGDRRHGTAFARQFRPYALHHLADTWAVMRHLLLPEGEYAYPGGQDWALHVSSHQSYFAFVATALGDPVAALAERRGFTAARLRARASRSRRIYGATNFEWWWDPITLKRFATAIIHLTVAPEPAPAPAPAVADTTDTFFFPAVRIFGHRTPRYFASVSMRGRPMGLVIPLGERRLEHPYVTTPRVGSILPAGTLERFTRHTHDRGAAVVMHYADGSGAAMIALRNVVLWVAGRALGPLAIQNDNVVTGRGRTVQFAGGSRHVPPLEPLAPFVVPGTWLTVDGELGLLTEAGFRYVPAGRYTRRSAAEDLVVPRKGRTATCLLVAPRCPAAPTARLAGSLRVAREGRLTRVWLRDGVDGPLLCATVDLGRWTRTAPPADITVDGSAHPRRPVRNLLDDDPATWAIFRNADGGGPAPDAPIVLEFSAPAGAGAPRALRIVPRPRYGPREAVLAARRAGKWHTLATAELRPAGPTDIALPALEGASRLRLVISKGWDRGQALGSAPRNTQIAELRFLLAEAEMRDAPTPFDLRVVEPEAGPTRP
jgi:hypothetical protein